MYPDTELRFAPNFLTMMFSMGQIRYHPEPGARRTPELMLILHADHEQNCSTTRADDGLEPGRSVFAIAGGSAALCGPLHGGANEAVLEMLEQIDDGKNVPGFASA